MQRSHTPFGILPRHPLQLASHGAQDSLRLLHFELIGLLSQSVYLLGQALLKC